MALDAGPEAGRGEEVSPRSQASGQKAETRRRILAAARRVFLRDSYAEANLNEVATLAGVGKGTLYRHFENKGELYVAMLTEHGGCIVEELRGALDPHAPALRQIEQLAGFYLDFWLRHSEQFQVIWAVQNRRMIGPISKELADHVRLVFEGPLRLLEGLIRTGIDRGEIRACDPWDTANAIAMAANAMVGPIVTEAEQVVDRDLRAVYRRFCELVLTGLSAAPPAPGPV
jgi:AcrR family transcriptional regulator